MLSHPSSTVCSRIFWFTIIVILSAAPGPARATPGDIYVSRCCYGDEIDRVSPDGSVTTFATSGLNSPSGLAFDTAGNLFVANYGNDTVEKFAPNGVGTVFASAGLSNPGGLAFDASGNLFVANYGNDTIEKFAPNGVGTVFASAGLSLPAALAFDASGNLFVANGGNNTIERFTSSGIASVFASSVFSDPSAFLSALAIDKRGNLFVSNWFTMDGDNTSVRFTPGGMKSPFATMPEEVEGFAFDNAGNLLVVDGGLGDLLAFAPDGDQRVIASGLGVATNLAVEPVVSSVAEPATILVLATAVTGLCLTRRRIVKGALRL